MIEKNNHSLEDFGIYTVSGGRISVGIPEEEEKCAWCKSTEDVKHCFVSHDVQGHGEVVGSVPYCAECRKNSGFKLEVAERRSRRR
jgi:hypothetical protein